MDSDQGKLFIGGISWETTEETLQEYFAQYGDLAETVVMRDKLTGRPRGFGFVVFADPSVLDRVLETKHTIEGRTVDAKRALSREEQQTSGRSGNNTNSRNTAAGGNARTKKIFVGGLPPTVTEEGFREYFENYGQVTDVVVMYDQNTNRPRGFGFITFDAEDAVDRVLHKTFHDLDGKQVEVKRALPKDANPGGGSRGGDGNGGGAGAYQGYGASGGNPNLYDNRMDSSRYVQPQNASGAFSGYSAPGYGYGPASNGIGYGGYGSYGSTNVGYGGPAGMAYGNSNIANAGYGAGHPGAPRGSWGTQAPAGYGAMGYGNAGPWGASNASSGGSGSAPEGQAPSGAAVYGNQGYGYGAIGGQSGNSGSQGGGDLQGGYGDANGNQGYGNVAWRSDPSQASGNYGTPGIGAQVGYGGGYGGAQT